MDDAKCSSPFFLFSPRYGKLTNIISSIQLSMLIHTQTRTRTSTRTSTQTSIGPARHTYHMAEMLILYNTLTVSIQSYASPYRINSLLGADPSTSPDWNHFCPVSH